MVVVFLLVSMEISGTIIFVGAPNDLLDLISSQFIVGIFFQSHTRGTGITQIRYTPNPTRSEQNPRKLGSREEIEYNKA